MNTSPVDKQKISDLLTAAASAPDAAARQTARSEIAHLDSSALPVLADFMGISDPVMAKAAKAGMEQLVHFHLSPPPGQNRPDGGVRSRVADQLVAIARSSRPRLTRAHALYLLGFSGVQRHEKAVEALEKDPQVGENARMARKRIQAVHY